MFEYVVIVILAYLIGSIPSGLIIGKKFYGVDIRQHGSGNLGGTNTFRVLGVKAGLTVTTADILKGTLAAALPFLFQSDLNLFLAGFFAVIGHTYPIFANFKGGKAVATSAGVLLCYASTYVCYCHCWFLCLFIYNQICILILYAWWSDCIYLFTHCSGYLANDYRNHSNYICDISAQSKY